MVRSEDPQRRCRAGTDMAGSSSTGSHLSRLPQRPRPGLWQLQPSLTMVACAARYTAAGEVQSHDQGAQIKKDRP